MEMVDVSSAADRLAKRRAADMATAQASLKAQAAPMTPISGAPATAATPAVQGNSYRIGKAVGNGGRLISGMATNAAIAAPLAGFGDYQINDAGVDSSAGGVISNIGAGNLADAGKGLQKGAVEAGLDSVSGIAKGGDFIAGLGGFQPNLAGKFANVVQNDLGNMVTINPSLTAAPAALPSVIPNAAAAPNPNRAAAPVQTTVVQPTAQPGPIAVLNNPNALNNVVGSAVPNAPGITKLQGGMFNNPMYTDNPIRAANEFNQPNSIPVATPGTATAATGNGIGTPGPVSGMSAALSAARAAAADRGDFDAVRKSYQVGDGTFNGETTLETAIRQTTQDLQGATGQNRTGLIAQLGALREQEATKNQQTNAASDLAIKSAAAKSDEQLKQGQIANMNQLQTLSKKIDEAKPGTKEHEQLLRKYQALSGKNPAQNKYTVIPGEQSVDPQTMAVIKGPSLVLDNETGQLVDLSGGAKKSTSALAQADARAAIAKGMSKEEVNKRLKAAGHPTI